MVECESTGNWYLCKIYHTCSSRALGLSVGLIATPLTALHYSTVTKAEMMGWGPIKEFDIPYLGRELFLSLRGIK
jgi:hypothetical protein